MPTARSPRITSGPCGRRLAMRSSSKVVASSSVALASSTGVPSAFSAQTLVRVAPSAGISAKARTSSPSTTILRKWLEMQPRSNQSSPQIWAINGSNCEKCVGPSIGPARKPSFSAMSSSWIELWPPYSCSASIWRGLRSGPDRMSGVSKLMGRSPGDGLTPPKGRAGDMRRSLGAGAARSTPKADLNSLPARLSLPPKARWSPALRPGWRRRSRGAAALAGSTPGPSRSA